MEKLMYMKKEWGDCVECAKVESPVQDSWMLTLLVPGLYLEN